MKINKTIMTAILLMAVSFFLIFKNQIYNIFIKGNNEMSHEIEKTFAIIKPDAVSSKNSGKIIDVIEKNDFDILKIQKLTLSKEQAEKFYDEHKTKPFFKAMASFMTSDPVIIMVLSKKDAILAWRKLMGPTNPENAEAGTIRKMFGSSIEKNAVHGSDSKVAAKREIGQFFPELA